MPKTVLKNINHGIKPVENDESWIHVYTCGGTNGLLLFNLNESNKFETGLTDDIGNPQQISWMLLNEHWFCWVISQIKEGTDNSNQSVEIHIMFLLSFALNESYGGHCVF